jgi:hypothetical protein
MKKGNRLQDLGLEGRMLLKCILKIVFYACICLIEFVVILYMISAVPFPVALRV